MTGLLTLCTVLSLTAAADPEIHSVKPRLLFRTVAGDLVFTLDPSLAPNTVKKLCELTANGVYNGTHFHRLEPGFVLQLSTAEDRKVPLTPDQASRIQKLKAEFTDTKHRKGVLSMARMDNDPDSATTSFSILLGDAPHLDGKYTIFGEMTHGWEVVEMLTNEVPRVGSQPVVRLTVNEALYIAPGETLPTLTRAYINPKAKAEAEALAYSASKTSGSSVSASSELVKVAALSLGLMVVIGLVNVFLTRWTSPRRVSASANQANETTSKNSIMIVLRNIDDFLYKWITPALLRSINLLLILIGVVLFMILATPLTVDYPWVGIILFFGLLCVFKIMGSFESAS